VFGGIFRVLLFPVSSGYFTKPKSAELCFKLCLLITLLHKDSFTQSKSLGFKKPVPLPISLPSSGLTQQEQYAILETIFDTQLLGPLYFD